MSDDLVKQALEELQDLVRCRCHDAYKGRGLHDPTCCCDSAEAVKVVSDRIEALEAQVRAADALADALENAVEELRFLIPGYAGAAVTEQQVEEDVSDYVAALAAYEATKEQSDG